ncbi:MAG: S8 family serine peptidase [Bacteroidota bacterium]|jgi:serine protease
MGLKQFLIYILICCGVYSSRADTFFVRLSDTSGFRSQASAVWGKDLMSIDYPFCQSKIHFLRKVVRVSVASSIRPELVSTMIPNIERVYPQVIYQQYFTPNDSLFASFQWYLTKIRTEQAWEYSRGEPFIKIALVDDAIDINHPDLAENIAVNVNEIPGNGLDDDTNGYIDDYKGYDVSLQSPVVTPPTAQFRHGTHLAGLMAASSNNLRGIASVCHHGRLLPIKCTDNFQTVSHGLEGVVYAIDAGADVVNMSWGSPFPDPLLKEVIDTAVYQSKIFFVAAAGNMGDSLRNYPAAFENVVAVSATDQLDQKLSSSSFGDWIEIAAPGSSLLSTEPGNGYAYMSGTSVAAPLVSASIGLLLSYKAYLTKEELMDCLLNTADSFPNPSLHFGRGRLNLEKAMACAGLLGLVNPAISKQSENPLGITNQSKIGMHLYFYSLLGQCMYHTILPPGGSLFYNTLHLPDGIYILRSGHSRGLKISIHHG